jgi:hypothetical protein
MRNPRLMALVLAAASLLRADPLSDLRQTLQGLQGRTAVKGNLVVQTWRRGGDAKAPVEVQGKAWAWVEDDAQGMRVSWSRAMLDEAEREATARAKDPAKRSPTRAAMGEITPHGLSECVGAAKSLLVTLETAEFQGERPEPYGGQQARCLSFKVQHTMSKDEQKYVKEVAGTAKVWLGSDGTPLGAQRTLDLKGRAMLIISFEHHEREEMRFAKVSDRLVATWHQLETTDSGGGESGTSRTSFALELK